jgi:peroxiredoxin Q/BCP
VSFRENGERLREFDVAYFTASCNDAETNQKFAASLELDYPVLSDPAREVAAKYGVVNEERPNPFRWTFYIGKDGKILFIDKDVRADSSGADCAARLKALGVTGK